MKPALASLIFLSWWTFASAAAPPRVLTPRGLGPVHVGMTLAQARAALHAKFEMDYGASGGPGCGYGVRADKADPGVAYMVESGLITRIDVFAPEGRAAGSTPAITTADGIGLGASEADVRKAYRGRLKAEPHPYDERGLYLKVDNPRKTAGIIFEVLDGRVISFRAGRYPAVAYIEGCA